MNDNDVDGYLHYLIETAEAYATAVSSSKYYERFLKSIESKHFLEAQGTIDQRKSYARTHPEYVQALSDARDVDYDSALLFAKREHAKISISWAQSSMKAKSESVY
jgi:hypothetical protein